MLERLKHHFNKGRCLTHLYWENGLVRCNVCNDVVGMELENAFHVFHDYIPHDSVLRDFWAKTRVKHTDDESDWREVRQEIAGIRLPEDPSYIPRQCLDEEGGIPVSEMIYDGEDSAAGDFYLGDDVEKQAVEDL